MPFDIFSYLLGKNSGSGGGGNPNRRVVINGTMEHPWGDMTAQDYQNFLYAYSTNQAWSFLLVDTGILGYGEIGFMLNVGFIEPDYIFVNLRRDDVSAGDIAYDGLGNLSQAYMLLTKDGEIYDLKDSASMFTTTLYIYYFPMPD